MSHNAEKAAAYRPIAGHWCGQTQPHAAHEWQTPPAYGAATFIQTYQCGGHGAAREVAAEQEGVRKGLTMRDDDAYLTGVSYGADEGAARVIAAVEAAADREHAGGCHYQHQRGSNEECNSCTAARIQEAALGVAPSIHSRGPGMPMESDEAHRHVLPPGEGH